MQKELAIPKDREPAARRQSDVIPRHRDAALQRAHAPFGFALGRQVRPYKYGDAELKLGAT